MKVIVVSGSMGAGKTKTLAEAFGLCQRTRSRAVRSSGWTTKLEKHETRRQEDTEPAAPRHVRRQWTEVLGKGSLLDRRDFRLGERDEEYEPIVTLTHGVTTANAELWKAEVTNNLQVIHSRLSGAGTR